jgi:hypothetical protein
MQEITLYLPSFNACLPACLPACQLALQPLVSLGLLYNKSPPGVRFLNKIIFYRLGL